MRPVTPELTHAFTIEALIDQPRSAGPSPDGERLHITITGGNVSGKMLNGRILPGGSDWPVIGNDGNSKVEAHYTIETNDGVLIYVINRALRISTPEVLKRLRAGETVSPQEYYFRGSPAFDAPNGEYQWLREKVFVCSLCPGNGNVTIEVFVVE